MGQAGPAIAIAITIIATIIAIAIIAIAIIAIIIAIAITIIAIAAHAEAAAWVEGRGPGSWGLLPRGPGGVCQVASSTGVLCSSIAQPSTEPSLASHTCKVRVPSLCRHVTLLA
ncbi:hypothetical protein GRJ2_001589000 [Grus japonensis]|uniref:Uncharacterized protein n=1 Tax=Grus japonensis TaxID=30415 RepID=A0ABC9X1G5_GRUJA